MTILPASFYNEHVVSVARGLIGQTLVFNGIEGIITETEAYRGLDDEASHAFHGVTPRTLVMFGPPAYSYVYFIYGMYYCLNIVTEPEGTASAVLVRGLKLPDIHLNGPGKLCRHLGITKAHNGICLVNNPTFCVKKTDFKGNLKVTPRIGITKSKDKLWRFVMEEDSSIPFSS